jgi:hypothetical protein
MNGKRVESLVAHFSVLSSFGVIPAEAGIHRLLFSMRHDVPTLTFKEGGA